MGVQPEWAKLGEKPSNSDGWCNAGVILSEGLIPYVVGHLSFIIEDMYSQKLARNVQTNYGKCIVIYFMYQVLFLD